MKGLAHTLHWTVNVEYKQFYTKQAQKTRLEVKPLMFPKDKDESWR